MRFRHYTYFVCLALLSAGQLATAGVIADITSDCTTGCISITYSGAPGPSPTGNAVVTASPPSGIWGHLSDFGLPGDWISYGYTGHTPSGQPVGSVDFTLNYSLNPAWNITGVVINIMADDFASFVSSPINFGTLPSWGVQQATHCSATPPGCLDNELYTHTLTAPELAAFLGDNQLLFTVTQLVSDTPFGLAFDIRLLGTDTSSPEPGTLALVGGGLLGGWAVLRRRGKPSR